MKIVTINTLFSAIQIREITCQPFIKGRILQDAGGGALAAVVVEQSQQGRSDRTEVVSLG